MSERERPAAADCAGAARAPGDARPLLAEWLGLTARLLGDFRVTVGDLQELLVAQGRVAELVERSAEQAPEKAAEDEAATVFRRVL